MEYEVKCLRLDDCGRGIVMISGKVTFVSNLLPDEVAIVRICENRKKFMIGRVVRYISMSDDRILPKCICRDCGCHLGHLCYKGQLLYKRNKVVNILSKFASMNIDVNDVVYDGNVYGYRNKITLKVLDGVGYFKNGSNEFIHIDRCEFVSDRVNELIGILNLSDLSLVNEIVIKDFSSIMLIVDGVMDVSSCFDMADVIYVDGKLVKGDGFVYASIFDLKFRVSKDSFFQVNKYMVEKLYDTALSYLGDDRSKSVLDLYCGTGTISLLASKRFDRVVGVEINSSAIECANFNKKINGIDNVEFICGDVSDVIGSLKADRIIVDPPRSGLSLSSIDDIFRINPEVIVYISCDPVTLARDLKRLGTVYDVTEVTPVDMFPNTYHVECVSLLQRKELEK